MSNAGEFEHQTMRQAKAIGRGVADVASHTREHLMDALEEGRSRAGDLQRRARDVAYQVRDRGIEGYHRARGHVERHPLASALVAVAGGLGLALLITQFARRR